LKSQLEKTERMNVNISNKKTARVRTLLTTALALGGALGAVTQVDAQNITSPNTTFAHELPEGTTAFLVGNAEGTQGYVCLPSGTGASWTINQARPEATLFTKIFGVDFEIITHFLSPVTSPNGDAPKPLPFGNATWQSSFDNSKVWAKAVDTLPAGSTADCPNAGSIACLLLQSIGNEAGKSGGKALTQVNFVERLNTKGGSAPATGCSVTADVGKQALVPYTADYYFFRAGK
jgi:hypothetical protein